MGAFTYPHFECSDCPELGGGAPGHYDVAIVGAGPVGLVAAIDLALAGVRVVVLDGKTSLSEGSRAICWAKRTLEICDRIGVGDRLVAKGVTWHRGKVFLRGRQLYEFDLLPEPDHKRPAFINLQQYHFEDMMVARARVLPLIDLRWHHRVVGQSQSSDRVALSVETPKGNYAITAGWVLAADGVRSTVRRLMGLEFEGQVFRDRFLIADIRMKTDRPAVRRFWFSPPFHNGQSALMHKQSDDVWRIDLQLGWDADPELEKQPERVMPRLKRMLGPDADIEIEWTSVYTFACRRMDRFRHGRVLFVGDSAHVISPYGARGGNGGVQDVDNLVWKLRLVIDGAAPDRLLDSYDDERIAGAEENMLHSTRSTDFITPKSPASRAFRDAVLELARDYPFARRLVNSGRLSTPTTYVHSPLNTQDGAAFAGAMVPGAPAADAPVRHGGRDDWLLHHLGGGFTLLAFGKVPKRSTAALAALSPPVVTLEIGAGLDLEDFKGVVADRYDTQPGTCYLLRPDQHVAARWRGFDVHAVSAALGRAVGRDAD